MELPKRYDPKESEKRWQEFWLKHGIYKFDPDSKAEVYAVDTPPPTVSGVMHMGHAFSYAQQDFIVRFQRMLGRNIFYPWGFDDNGLPTERFVEKKIGKKAVEMPRNDFIKECLKHTKDVEEKLKKDWMSMGMSPDWDISYRTIDERARRMSQLSFIDLYKKGREYRKEAPTIWCPECRTAIAQVELEDKKFSSFFNDIVFKLENGKDLIIATTRPELLPACVAIFAHPDDKRYKKLFGKKAKVPLLDYYVPIIADERADPEKGTGAVMCCTFGDLTDVEWWHAHKLPLRIAITQDGKMNELAEKYEGHSMKTARKLMIEDMKDQKLLLTQTPISHDVNVHERCGTEVEFLVTKQWFIKYLDLKKRFLKAGNEMNWYPKYMKHRYDNWIKGLQWDWCISRQRYYGVPFPVWYCKKCGEIMIADEKDLPVDPLTDKPKKPCPKCKGEEFIPEKDILDTWATSSLTPMLVSRWKEDNKYFKKVFPMTLRPQAHDIITFWLFNTVVKSLLHEGVVPWKDIMISGHALDPKGKKMSKSKGNVIDPLKVMENYSADALRFWAAGSKLGEDLPYQEKDLVTGKKFINKLWNASKFAIMHLEDYKLEKPKLEPIDRWILSKLNRLIKENTESFMNYEYARTRSDIEKFFWGDLCDNYLEIVKDRLYNPEERGKESRKAAQYTLYTSILTCLKLTAPIMPHITEEIYHIYFDRKEKGKSIHNAKWPEFDRSSVDEKNEEAAEVAIDIIGAVRKFKSEKNVSLKTEVKVLTIQCTEWCKKKIAPFMKDIESTTNAQKIEFGKGDISVGDKLKVKVELSKTTDA